MLTIQNVTYRVGGRLILEDASASVMPGRRVGVVGANGAGKSTLFKLITGELLADGGSISLSDRYSLGYVRQDIGDLSMPLLDVVLAADVERTALFKEAETAEDPYRIGEIYTRLDEIDAYAAPARASSILAGLGFKEDQLQEPLGSFSGGWRMRVALAGALFRQPDVLLLDEPTNHLDLEAIMWLEAYLANYPRTLLIISHDRELLNACITHVLHVENKKITPYTGNYNTFERERAEKLVSQQKLHEKQTAMRAHMQAFVDRFKAKASKAKQAQSRLKALEKMDVVDAVMADRGIKFNFPQPEELSPPILTVQMADVGYAAGAPVLHKVDERIDMDDRIALLGANGNGKSTLMKLIAGRLAPLAGKVEQSGKLRIGYFSQHQAEEMNLDETPFASMARVMLGRKEADIRAVLGRFGFGKVLADNKIGALSGGEKARLLFALMSYDAPHLLLLDEPTNHLDMDAREALVQALNSYQGAVVMVSHDPSMVERVADRLWLVANGKCEVFDGDLAAYRTYVIAQRREERRKDSKGAATAGPSKKELQKQLREKQQRHPALMAELDAAEKRVASLLKEKSKAEAALGAPDVYGTPQAAALQTQFGKLLKELAAAEEAWLALQTRFEEAE
jgi:ATP-binding cassette, subfamily F, member 3